MFGNRGFFPGELIASAIEEYKKVLAENGHEYLMLEESATRYGAVETIEEGKIFADFLEAYRGEFDGIIVSLPNFGDENGAVVALKNAGVPILIQAYPDEEGLMDFSHRRDALCGKIAMCNVLRQANIKYTLTEKFTVSPSSADFAEDLRKFAGVCRVVKGMKDFNLGAIGARTTAFKTVRCDEIAMQNRSVNVETIDMSVVFRLMDSADAGEIEEKKKVYLEYAHFEGYPESKLENMARFGVAVDKLIARYRLSAIAVRCWDELEITYGIAPCLAMSVLNNTGIAAACELDVNNAVMMRAISLASDSCVALFDVNNNYKDAKDKCIFFHCSAIPQSMLCEKGCVSEHLMFRKTYGEGSGVGIYVGRAKPTHITVGSLKTENGKLCAFVTEGRITDDPIEKAFFGCGIVFEKDDGDCQSMLGYMAKNGYRHHVAFSEGSWADSINEAFVTYLGYETDRI